MNQIMNQKLMVNQKKIDKVLRSLQSNISWKCGETDGAWLLGLNVVAMLVSVNMS